MAGDLSKSAWPIVWAGGLVIKVVPVWIRPWWPPDLDTLVRVQPWCNGSRPAARAESILRPKKPPRPRQDQPRRSRVQPWCTGSGPAARRQSCLRHKDLRCLRHDQPRRSRDL